MYSYITVFMHERTKCIYLQFDAVCWLKIYKIYSEKAILSRLSLHFSSQAQVLLSLCPTTFGL